MTEIPYTPRELARLVLLQAEKGEHFDMRSWCSKPEWLADGDHRVRTADIPKMLIGSEEQATECGTTACAAGWVGILTGVTIAIEGRAILPDGREVRLEAYARERLGLDPGQAKTLFHTTTEVAKILLRQLAEGEPFDYPGAYRELYDHEPMLDWGN